MDAPIIPYIRCTHTGLTPGGATNTSPVLITDLDTGLENQHRKVPSYVPVGGFIDIPATARSLLSFDNGVLRRFHDAGYIVADLIEPSAETTIIYVDADTPLNADQQNGSQGRPYGTLASAVAAIPVATTDDEMRSTTYLMVSGKAHDEDFNIDITGRKVWVLYRGGFSIGEFAGSGGTESGIRRNINITGDASGFGGLVSSLGFASMTDNPSWHQTSTTGETMMRLSGTVNIDLTGAAALSLALQCEIRSSDGSKAGDSILATATSNVFLYIEHTKVRGNISGALLTLVTAARCRFTGEDITLNRISQALHSDFQQLTFTVSAAYTSMEPAGFIGCRFKNAMVFTGPVGSLIVDGYSNSSAKTAGVILAGGATKVFIGAAYTSIFNGGGTPTTGQHYEAQAAVGGTAGTLGVGTRMASPGAFNLTKLSWESTSADATTIMKILVNGAVADTVTLTGVSGAIALPLQAVVAEGDVVAVEFDAGTAPGASTVQVYGQ